jgi:hypothetical protein
LHEGVLALKILESRLTVSDIITIYSRHPN